MDVDDPHYDPREGSATATDDDEDIEEWEIELNNAIAEYGKGGAGSPSCFNISKTIHFGRFLLLKI